MLAGAAIFILGGILYLLGRSGVTFGRLPGDFRFQWGSITCFFPLATSILVSLLLTVGLNLLARFLNK